MEKLAVPRLMIAGVGAGVGKSLIAIGLGYELQRRGVSASFAVVGPHLLQSMVHRRTSGRFVRSLDTFLLTGQQILEGLYHSGVGADIVIVDGHAGLLDGVSPDSLKGADAEIAALGQIPTVLVVDARGLAAGVAPILKGYCDLARGFDVIGALLNRVPKSIGGQRGIDQNFFEAVVQSYGLRPVFGAVPEVGGDLPTVAGRLSQKKNVTALPRQFFVDIARAVADHVNIDQLLVCAGDADPIQLPDFVAAAQRRRARIAVSDDACFGLCFQDNLDLLRYYGAEILPFSPLADSELPKRIGALYLTGAYLQEYASDLTANESMRKSIADFAAQGGVIYAEGGGTIYLCREFRMGQEGGLVSGVGVVPATAMVARGSFSYCDSVTTEDSILGKAGSLLKGVYVDDFRILREERVVKTLHTTRHPGGKLHEGFSPSAQITATLSFQHFGSNPEVAKSIVDAAEVSVGSAGRRTS